MNKFSQSWKSLPWKKFQRKTFNIQKRIYKAIQAGDIRRAKMLQKLIIRSRAARFLAVRQIIQLNNGRKTAGVDGMTQKNYTFRRSFELSEDIRDQKWEHSKVRRIKIPKGNNKFRTLGIPTIKDRVWQCLMKMAIEPAPEAIFHPRSYGFRAGRSTHDCQKIMFLNLSSRQKGYEKRILSLDIKSCFDEINHTSILNRIICPRFIKENIHRCLIRGGKVGYPEDKVGKGTVQGGVISPLLANIALDGIEDIHQSVRYADDMVFFLKPKDDEKEIINKIEEFLGKRGLEINKSKTKIYESKEGIDFLGWHFKVQKNGKFRSYPSDENYRNVLKKIKRIVNCSNIGSKEKAKILGPIVRGWRKYHRYCRMDKHRLYHTTNKAWHVFNKEQNNDRRKVDTLIGKAFPVVPYSENKHINVKGAKSPYDGDMVYWSRRNSNKYDGLLARVMKRQDHICGECGLNFFDEERVHLHHIDSNHNNWKCNNLVVVHESCHDYIHMGKRSEA